MFRVYSEQTRTATVLVSAFTCSIRKTFAFFGLSERREVVGKQQSAVCACVQKHRGSDYSASWRPWREAQAYFKGPFARVDAASVSYLRCGEYLIEDCRREKFDDILRFIDLI